MIHRITGFLGLLLALATGARAQTWEVGAGLGGFLYKGDIAPNFAFRNYRPAGNVLVRYHLSQAVTLRFNAGLGSLAATERLSNDPFQQARNVSFRSRMAEGAFLVEYNFLNFSDLRKVKNWTPYAFGGLGVHHNGLQVQQDNRPLGRIHFPLGVGVRYEFKRPWSLGLEFGTRFTSTDYLDGYGPATFTGTDKLRQGDPRSKDHYTYTGLILTYRFYRITCP